MCGVMCLTNELMMMLVCVSDYSCDHTMTQKSLLVNMAVAMIAMKMKLMIIKALMIMMIASLLSSHFLIWTYIALVSLLLVLQPKSGN